jgi:hypothetical protein
MEKKMIMPIRIVFFILLFLVILNFVWIAYKILILTKIDFTQSIKYNLMLVNKFKYLIKVEKIINYYIITPVCIALGVISYYLVKASSILWIFLVSCVFAGIFTTVVLYRYSHKKINNMIEGLKELEEFEKDPVS